MRSALRSLNLWLGIVTTVLLTTSPGLQSVAAAQDVSAQAVKDAIRRGVDFLRKDLGEEFNDSTNGQRGGLPAMKALAMLNAGVSAADPDVKFLLDRIRRYDRERELGNYAVSLRVMALAAADPEGKRYLREIRQDVDWLVETQVKQGRHVGGWSYNAPGRRGGATADASNSQFALLALHEASNVGVKVDQQVWERASQYWTMNNDPRKGGFDYTVKQRRDSRFSDPRGSMTCAGIASWVIISEQLAKNNRAIKNGRVVCCPKNLDEPFIEKASEWIGRNFTVRENPRHRHGQLYFLYALERAGRLSGQRFFGAHDWYREGAAHLLKKQRRGGSFQSNGAGYGEGVPSIATCFAVLFLSKGKAPIVFGKYEHGVGEDWDRHPKGVHQLTGNLTKRWNKKLNWQTVRGRDASLDDLLEARVLFLSGRDDLDLNEQQKRILKQYIENGGFLLAESIAGDGCGGGEFDAKFRNLMAELFPESQLELLPPDHPIWTADYFVEPQKSEFPVWGLQACCRTSVIYVPRSLSCRWQVDKPQLKDLLNNESAEEVDYCSQLGVNVATYATGRQLRDKLDIPKVDTGNSVLMLKERVLVLPKLSHGGGADEAPNAWRNVLLYAQNTRSGMRIRMDKKMLDAQLDQLQDHPFVFMHGRDRFSFTKQEREDLRTWIDRGGFLFVDSICSSKPFVDSFRKEMKELYPDNPLQPVSASHPLWVDPKFGTPLQQVTLREPDSSVAGGFRTRTTHPLMEGIEVNGQLQVLFSPYDLSCAMENTAVSQCKGYSRDDATIMAVKVLIYYLRRGLPDIAE